MRTPASWSSRLALLLALSLTVASCDSGSSPTSPSIPQAINVTGNWSGTMTISGVDGGGCVGELYLPLIGMVMQVEMSLQQSGSAISGTVRMTIDGDDLGTAFYSGSIHSDRFEVSIVGMCTPWMLECRNGRRLMFCMEDSSFEGVVSNSRLEGTYLELHTSSEVNDLRFRGVFTLTRSP